MAAKYPLLWVVFILLFSFTAADAIAQPTLPDITGAADKGIVILSWTCQYSGIKSITVLRSSDSVSFSPIGKVKKLNKGIQAFVDGHPAGGTNYYKLILLFASGLSWSSNHCSVTIAQTEKTLTHLPSNDSLQRFITTSDTVKPGKTAVVSATKPVVKDILAVDPEEDYDQPASKTKTPAATNPDDDVATDAAPPKRKVYISFDMDTIRTDVRAYPQADKKPEEHRKVIIAFDDPTTGPTTFIKSLYVYTDPATGHVDLNLPGDVATHHYSIKFYDEQNHMIIEVPRLNSSKIILDKRNFQRKGIFKFVLRKDVTELESGYIELK